MYGGQLPKDFNFNSIDTIYTENQLEYFDNNPLTAQMYYQYTKYKESLTNPSDAMSFENFYNIKVSQIDEYKLEEYKKRGLSR